jgi:hypothetical protein
MLPALLLASRVLLGSWLAGTHHVHGRADKRTLMHAHAAVFAHGENVKPLVCVCAGAASSAQEAARAAFAVDKGGDGFYSSDDEESQSSTSLSAATSAAGGPKFKARTFAVLPRPAACTMMHRAGAGSCRSTPCSVSLAEAALACRRVSCH